MRKRGRFEAPSAPRPSWKQTNVHLQVMVSSAVSMLLCCSMLLGTTMAWFTDSVVSAGNQITIGTLDVDITYNGRSLNPAKGENPEAVFASELAWSPDHFEARILTAKNFGNLDAKYILNLQVSKLEIAKYFDVYVNTGSDIKTGSLSEQERSGWINVGNLAQLYGNGTSVFTGNLPAARSASEPTTQIIGIALCMCSDISGVTEEGESIFGEKFTLYVMMNAYQTELSDADMQAMNASALTSVVDEAEEAETAEKELSGDENTGNKLISDEKAENDPAGDEDSEEGSDESEDADNESYGKGIPDDALPGNSDPDDTSAGGNDSAEEASGGDDSGEELSNGDDSGNEPSGGDDSGDTPSGGDDSGEEPSGGDNSGEELSGNEPSGSEDTGSDVPNGNSLEDTSGEESVEAADSEGYAPEADSSVTE